MYNLLLPIRTKSNIRGLWLHKNKIYKDNLKSVKHTSINKTKLKKLANTYNQIALFYHDNKKGFIYNRNSGYTDKLNNKILLHHKKFKGLKSKVKKLLYKYKGLTIINHGIYYKLLCYY